MCEWSNGEPVNNNDLQSCLVVEKIVNTGSVQASLTAPLSCYLAIMGEIGNGENVSLWTDCTMNRKTNHYSAFDRGIFSYTLRFRLNDNYSIKCCTLHLLSPFRKERPTATITNTERSLHRPGSTLHLNQPSTPAHGPLIL